MHLVSAYVNPHPLAVASLKAFAPSVERVAIGPESDAYWKLMSELWAEETDCGFIEQDIEIHAAVRLEFAQCAEPWCVFPYNGPGYGQVCDYVLTKGLGCVRFAKELVKAHPRLVADLENCTWRRLDVEVAASLEKLGYSPHIHVPNVRQHHVYQDLCACDTDHEPFPIDDEGRYAPTE